MWERISGLLEHVGWEFNSGLIFPALYCIIVAGNCRSVLALHASAGAVGAVGAGGGGAGAAGAAGVLPKNWETMPWIRSQALSPAHSRAPSLCRAAAGAASSWILHR